MCQVSNIQFKVLARTTLLLVDTLPCIGGATLTLLDVPHIDFKLKALVSAHSSCLSSSFCI